MSSSESNRQPTSLRVSFSTRLGFVLAAAGSAVGLGNIWSFPTQAAQNGGAAFVVMYLALSLLLAYPVLIAELVIGRYGQSNPITALERLPFNHRWRTLTKTTGIVAILFVCLIYSFYSIVGGWLLGFTLSSAFAIIGLDNISLWLVEFSVARNLIMATLFIGLTILVVNGGVKEGIERWSGRLMPALIILLIGLIAFVLTREGATEGLKHYLIPDFSRINSQLVMSALGQAFFSMSLGVGVMIVYGSYLKRDANLPITALQVCFLDTGIAFLAGLLIIPALFVAQNLGVSIFLPNGELVNSDTLVFEVLPALFQSMGPSGIFVALAFFSLMTIAALTSSISMLEAPVSCMTERFRVNRTRSCVLVSLSVLIITALIIVNFDLLFNAVITLTTQYAQPINSLLICIYAGWLMCRNQKLQEIKKGWPDVENSLFWKIWPWHIRLVCPLLIAGIIIIQA
ncbi:transporter [Endozoicomonas sp. (ex Bugula neritina AB1)]|nr:transporter [Endozoicomonas sp. (ex Bugula neritina AB1)]